MILADMTAGDWIAIAGTIGTGLVTGGGLIAGAIRFAFNKYAEIRTAERKHEAAISQKLTESVEKIQQQASADGRAAFASLIQIQRDAMTAVTKLTVAVETLDASVNELRSETTGRKRGKRRPTRPPEPSGADNDQ